MNSASEVPGTIPSFYYARIEFDGIYAISGEDKQILFKGDTKEELVASLKAFREYLVGVIVDAERIEE